MKLTTKTKTVLSILLLSLIRILCAFNLFALSFLKNSYVILGINLAFILAIVILLIIINPNPRVMLLSLLLVLLSFGINFNLVCGLNKEVYGIVSKIYLYIFIGIIVIFEIIIRKYMVNYKEATVYSWIITSQFVMLGGLIGILSSVFAPPSGVNLILWIILIFVAFTFYIITTIFELNFIANKKNREI